MKARILYDLSLLDYSLLICGFDDSYHCLKSCSEGHVEKYSDFQSMIGFNKICCACGYISSHIYVINVNETSSKDC